MADRRREARAPNSSAKKSVPKTKGPKQLDPDKPRHWSWGDANYRCRRCGSNVRYREITYTTPKGSRRGNLKGRKKHVGLICKDAVACRRARKKLTDLERLLLDDNAKAHEQIQKILGKEDNV